MAGRCQSGAPSLQCREGQVSPVGITCAPLQAVASAAGEQACFQAVRGCWADRQQTSPSQQVPVRLRLSALSRSIAPPHRITCEQLGLSGVAFRLRKEQLPTLAAGRARRQASQHQGQQNWCMVGCRPASCPGGSGSGGWRQSGWVCPEHRAVTLESLRTGPFTPH